MRIVRMLAWLLAAAAVVVGLAALIRSPAPGQQARPPAAPGVTGTRPPVTPDPRVDRTDPDATCGGFAAALLTHDAAVDSGPHEAYRRAAAYATAELADSLVTTAGRWPAGWERWTASHGQVTPYTGDHLRPDSHHIAYRAVTVTGGEADPPGRHLVYCTLRRTAATWQVAAYQTERRTLP